MVERLKALPDGLRGNSDKRRAMNADIREIVENGIECCELKDTGYCDSGIYLNVEKSFNNIIIEKLGRDAVKRANAGNKLYQVYRRRGLDGKNHFYVSYNPEEWERIKAGLSRS